MTPHQNGSYPPGVPRASLSPFTICSTSFHTAALQTVATPLLRMKTAATSSIPPGLKVEAIGVGPKVKVKAIAAAVANHHSAASRPKFTVEEEARTSAPRIGLS